MIAARAQDDRAFQTPRRIGALAVHLKPETQDGLERSTTETGRSADELVEEAMAGRRCAERWTAGTTS